MVLDRVTSRLRGQIDLRQPPAGQETAFLGLGGNVGDRLHYLNRAVALLDAHPRIVVDDISSVFETDPVRLPGSAPDEAAAAPELEGRRVRPPAEDIGDNPRGGAGAGAGVGLGADEDESDGAFLNVAVRVLTDLAPLPLLRACQKVESTLGRVRTVRWGPRTLDVDVLLYGQREVDTAVLRVPHPELTSRAFALVPLMEVAPGWRLPGGRSLGQAVAALAPIEGVAAIGRQVSRTPLPSGPPDRPGADA